MPFVSEAQRRWGNSPAGIKALGGKTKVAEWDRAAKGKRLPARKSGLSSKGHEMLRKAMRHK